MIRSIILSRIIVPNNLSNGVFSILLIVVHLVISPALGIIIFETYPIATALILFFNELLYPNATIIYVHLRPLNMIAKAPKHIEKITHLISTLFSLSISS